MSTMALTACNMHLSQLSDSTVALTHKALLMRYDILCSVNGAKLSLVGFRTLILLKPRNHLE